MFKIKNILNITWFLLLTFSYGQNTLAETITLHGAGATLPAPVYTNWALTYQQKTGIQVNYQAIGSGGGIKQIKAEVVDFGASDKPLDSAELEKDKLIQFPAIIGAIVPVVNLPGVQPNQLVLSGPLLADIYLGNIKQWNDPAIAKLNVNLKLPNLPIQPIYRSDGSGTTFLFTNFLSKMSALWNKNVGSYTAVRWPVGIGAKGNQGVAAFVQRLPGSIGYVEYAYVKQSHLIPINMQNAVSQLITPDVKNFQLAAAQLNWEPNNSKSLPLISQIAQQGWPIVGYSFILIPKKSNNSLRSKAVLDFFNWAYYYGQESAKALGYVPLPIKTVNVIKQEWTNQVKGPNNEPLWK